MCIFVCLHLEQTLIFMRCPSLSLVIFLVLKSTLSDIKAATLVFCVPTIYLVCLCAFVFKICLLQTEGSWVSLHNFCLLIGVPGPFYSMQLLIWLGLSHIFYFAYASTFSRTVIYLLQNLRNENNLLLLYLSMYLTFLCSLVIFIDLSFHLLLFPSY